jgi:branched-chain amino acid transport system substrate-binding protein
MALVMTACAGETTTSTTEAPGGSSTTAGAPSTTTASTLPPEPVRGVSEDGVVHLGSWMAQSGPLAVVANIANAMQLRFDIFNDAGGANGYTVDFTVIDDQANPTQTVNAVRELWEDEEVFALIAPYGSGGLSAVKDYLVENDVVTLFPFGDSRILFAEDPPPNAFGLVPFYSDVIDLMMETAQAEADVNSVVVLHTNDPLGEAGPEGAEMAAERLGMEVLEPVGYDATETNFAPLGRRLAESGADAILIWSFTGSVQILQAALEAGYEGTILLNDGFRGGFFFDQLLTLPFDLNGRTYTNIWFSPPDAPEAADYTAAFTEAYPDGDANIGQSGWAAAEAFIAALEQTTADGPLTWDAMRETFLTWEDETIGMASAISYTETERAGIAQGKVRLLEDSVWVDLGDWTPYFRYR